jgi:hypothetical protein
MDMAAANITANTTNPISQPCIKALATFLEVKWSTKSMVPGTMKLKVLEGLVSKIMLKNHAMTISPQLGLVLVCHISMGGIRRANMGKARKIC